MVKLLRDQNLRLTLTYIQLSWIIQRFCCLNVAFIFFFYQESCPTRSEVEALKLHLCEAGKLASETATYLKTELVEIKSQSLTDREGILNLVKDIQARVTRLMQRYSEEVEEFQKNLEEVMQSRDAEIESLKKVGQSVFV